MVVPTAKEAKYLKSVGKTIQAARIIRKISRAQLAFEIGTSERQLVRIERGEINTGILTVIKIGLALSNNPKDFLDLPYEL